jgi:hypothetical protein
VVDSRPELEGAELRRFAASLFAAYVAPDLLDAVRAARIGLIEARDRTEPCAAAAFTDALRVLDDVARVMTSGQRAAAPVDPGPLPPAPEPRAPISYLTPRALGRRGPRAREGGAALAHGAPASGEGVASSAIGG